MKNVCEICGKVLKNNHGRLVHIGRMHKTPTKNEVALVEYVKVLERKVDRLTEQVNQLSGNFVCGGERHGKIEWKPLNPPTAIRTIPEVPEGFVDELKEAIAQRGVLY